MKTKCGHAQKEEGTSIAAIMISFIDITFTEGLSFKFAGILCIINFPAPS